MTSKPGGEIGLLSQNKKIKKQIENIGHQLYPKYIVLDAGGYIDRYKVKSLPSCEF